MKNIRRICAWILTVVVVLTGMASYYTPADDVYAADSCTVIFHYQRDDGNYDGWDVWAWPEGSEGKAVKFTDEDSFGKVAVFKMSTDADKVGFIVRQSDWSDKDIGDDRFVTLSDGFAEVWITSGEEAFDITAPEGAEPYEIPEGGTDTPDGNTPATPAGEGDLTVNIHYHRYDDIYDGWNVWFWAEGADGAAYDFTGSDDFGKVATIKADASAANVGLIVRLNEWEQKDVDSDRFVETSKAVNGVLDVYLVQGDENVYFSADEMDLSPKFLSAALTTAKRIAVKVTSPLDCSAEDAKDGFKVVDQNGNSYELLNVFATTESKVTSTFNINMQEPLDLANSYTIVSETYGEIAVGYGEVFSTSDFESQFTYTGNDLGANWTKESTTFKVWSPTATKVVLNLYENGTDGDAYSKVEMVKGDAGVWSATVDGNLNKVYYTYTFTNAGTEKEAVDLYARTTGVNGKRGMVIDLSSTNPDGWSDDKRKTLKSQTDAAIYELHIRDFSIDESSGVTNKGKYLGLTEKGTKNATGQSTCLDYLVDLGITHVQIMPMYDFSPNSVDESKLDKAQFNWGYDPYNYNVPEGSYSTDPYNGEVRINEMKQMIQALHNENIGVIMDVVYNHTAETANSYFNISVPDYYYRLSEDGKYSNGSGCGNEVASERSMVRKYIVDSVVYWASEYHIDGFRFDLMGCLDIETMNEIRAALNEVDPSIIVYGEGWSGGGCALSESLRALKKNTYLIEGVGAFSDDIRDGLKGSVFDATDKGFATGKEGQEERIKSGVVAATDYPAINWEATGTDVKAPWAGNPTQVINYVSCHDNNTLWDVINTSNADDTLEDKIKMNKLAASVVYTAQGVPFMLSGEEILRTKPNASGTGFDHNSYKSSDETNSIKWDTLNDETTADVLSYYKGLISFRKTHSGLRMTTADEIKNNLKFIDVSDSNVIAYLIENQPNNECSDVICVIYNANKEAKTVKVPEGEWKVCIKDGKAGTEAMETFTGSEVSVAPISCLVMVQGDLVGKAPADNADSSFPWWIVVIIAVVVVIVAVVTVIAIKKKKSAPKAEKENTVE